VLVPAGVVTSTCTVPAACAGAFALNWVADTNVTNGDDDEVLNFTVAPGTKFVPWIVTVLPPAVAPPFGTTLVTVGMP
jgi:putative intracellular protease/amidase